MFPIAFGPSGLQDLVYHLANPGLGGAMWIIESILQSEPVIHITCDADLPKKGALLSYKIYRHNFDYSIAYQNFRSAQMNYSYYQHLQETFPGEFKAYALAWHLKGQVCTFGKLVQP